MTSTKSSCAVPALIIDTSNKEYGEILVTHADYFLSFDVHGIISQSYNDIAKGKYKNMELVKLKLHTSKDVYDRIMNKYMQYKLTNIMFNNYFGRNGVQFVPITVQELNSIKNEYGT